MILVCAAVLKVPVNVAPVLPMVPAYMLILLKLLAKTAPAIPAPPLTLNAPVEVLVEAVELAATSSPDLIVP